MAPVPWIDFHQRNLYAIGISHVRGGEPAFLRLGRDHDRRVLMTLAEMMREIAEADAGARAVRANDIAVCDGKVPIGLVAEVGPPY